MHGDHADTAERNLAVALRSHLGLCETCTRNVRRKRLDERCKKQKKEREGEREREGKQETDKGTKEAMSREKAGQQLPSFLVLLTLMCDFASSERVATLFFFHQRLSLKREILKTESAQKWERDTKERQEEVDKRETKRRGGCSYKSFVKLFFECKVERKSFCQRHAHGRELAS